MIKAYKFLLGVFKNTNNIDQKMVLKLTISIRRQQVTTAGWN